MSHLIYSNYLNTDKEDVFIKQVIYYEKGVYVFSCYPITRIEKDRCVLERAISYTGYKTNVHTCKRRSQKQDVFAIKEASNFYEANQITNY